VLPQASEEQVRLIRQAYEATYGKTMVEAIKDMGGDMEKALLARVHDKVTYYATVLNGAFAGWGTDEKATSRVLGRSTKGYIKRISERYEELFGGSLRQAINGETSGNFKKALLTYIFAEAPGEADSEPPGEDEAEEAPPQEEEEAEEAQEEEPAEAVEIGDAMVPKGVVAGFIGALRSEYVNDEGAMVGKFFDDCQVDGEFVEALTPYEDKAREADDKAAFIDGLAAGWGV